jgi:hypothetical protein
MPRYVSAADYVTHIFNTFKSEVVTHAALTAELDSTPNTIAMSSSPQASGLRALTAIDRQALTQLLDHKLYGVHQDHILYTIDEIIDGTQDLSRPYATPVLDRSHHMVQTSY